MTENDIQRGLRFRDALGEIRVMAVADGWALVRRGGGAKPFASYVKDMLKAFDAGTFEIVRKEQKP